MRKPFENTVKYDPGRFVHTVSFVEQVGVPNGSGGTTISYVNRLTTRAVREEIGMWNEVAKQAGVTSLNGGCFFVVRHRKGFMPLINMVLQHGLDQYTIRSVEPLGSPTTHIKILCAFKNAKSLTT